MPVPLALSAVSQYWQRVILSPSQGGPHKFPRPETDSAFLPVVSTTVYEAALAAGAAGIVLAAVFENVLGVGEVIPAVFENVLGVGKVVPAVVQVYIYAEEAVSV